MAERKGKEESQVGERQANESLVDELLHSAQFFFANLFDVRMRSIVTMAALPVVYALGILIIAGCVIALVVHGFSIGAWTGLFWLVIAGPMVFVASVALLRMGLEFLLAIFRLSIQMDAVVQQTREIAVDLPRLNFWKSFRAHKAPDA
ncbi:MAG TPA: DUF4282 domain-containing protein [Nevskiaceae bacterium]|nr:DUF4282 domain-containing protein [Nevskiaceae bacterium]